MGLFDFIPQALGLNTSQQNYNPSTIQLQNPVTQQQTQASIGQANTALGGYHPLMQAGLNTGVYGQQQQLANMMMQAAQGQGPNPAQNMLNQATANNTANQMAMMGSQRGANVNPNLVSKQAAMQGAANQQQAAGQAATMGAQQQLGAMQMASGQQAQMAGQNQAMQNAYTQAAQAQMQAMLGGSQMQNQAALGQGQIQAGMANAQGQQQAQMIGGLLDAGGAMGAAMLAEGGIVKDPVKPSTGIDCKPRPDTGWGAVICKAEGGKVPGTPEVNHNSYANDKVHAMLSPGELVIPLDAMKSKEAAMKFVEQHFGKRK